MAKLILLDFSNISSEIQSTWAKFLEVISDLAMNEGAAEEGREKFFKLLKLSYGESVFRNEHLVTDFSEFIGKQIGKMHREQAVLKRQNRYCNYKNEAGLSEKAVRKIQSGQFKPKTMLVFIF